MTQNLEEYLKNNTLKIGDSCINNMYICNDSNRKNDRNIFEKSTIL